MTLYIGDLATRTGEQVRTLRFWSDRGLLPAARADNGYRVFGQEALTRVPFIRWAQALGLPLEVIGRLLKATHLQRSPCAQVQAELEAQLELVRERVAALRRLEVALVTQVSDLQSDPCDAGGCRYLPPAATGPA